MALTILIKKNGPIIINRHYNNFAFLKSLQLIKKIC